MKIKYWIPLIAFMLLMASSVIATVTCTIEEDASGTIHNGTRSDGTYGMTWFGRANIIVNVSANTGFNNVTNCTASVVTRSGYNPTANTSANIDASRIGWWNMTANMDSYKYINDTVQTACGGTVGNALNACLEDGFYTLTVTCYNATAISVGGSCSDTANVMIDNTVPKRANITGPDDLFEDDDGDVTFDITSTTENITSCQLLFDSSGKVPFPSSYELLDASGVFSKEIKDMANTGSGYVWSWTCTDGKNESSTTKRTLYVDKPGGTLKNLAVAQAAAGREEGITTGGVTSKQAITIAVIAGGAYLTLFNAGIILRKKYLGF